MRRSGSLTALVIEEGGGEELHCRNPLLPGGGGADSDSAGQLPASSSSASPSYDFPYSPSTWGHPSGQLSPIRTRPVELSGGWRTAFGAGGPGPAYAVQVLVPLGSSADSPRGCCGPRGACRLTTARRLLLGTTLLLLLAVMAGLWFGGALERHGATTAGNSVRCWDGAVTVGDGSDGSLPFSACRHLGASALSSLSGGASSPQPLRLGAVAEEPRR